ncbi:MAG: hypothetical protein ACI4D8_08755 [Wujia sp.]
MGVSRNDDKEKGSAQIRLLSVSHCNRNGNIVSRLDYSYGYPEGLVAAYDVGSRKILGLLDKDTSFDEIIECYLGMAGFIGDSLSLDINMLVIDISTLFRMLYECKKNQQACSIRYYMLNWCTGIFLCSMLERLLGLLYQFQKHKDGQLHFILPSVDNLLRDEDCILRKFLTRKQLKNYVYLLSYDKKEKRGLEFRSQLCRFHYAFDTMSLTRVAQLLYIYTDILNSVLMYIINNKE